MADSDRKLASGFPGLDQLAFDAFTASQRTRPDDRRRVERVLRMLERLVELPTGASVAVIGCGPMPQLMAILRERGHRVRGIEPIPTFVEAAAEYLGDPEAVLIGAAESMPLPDASQDVVFFENVLEHVESPSQSFNEIFRVLRPGGVVWVTTTNRLRFSLRGENGEFNVPFYNWLPRLVKESYVFTHLHYRPSLANFTERPAVHWFSFADLCHMGRQAGFCQFYSTLDLRRPEDAKGSGALKRLVIGSERTLRWIQRSPWLRSFALTQIGADVIMLKRPLAAATDGGAPASLPAHRVRAAETAAAS